MFKKIVEKIKVFFRKYKTYHFFVYEITSNKNDITLPENVIFYVSSFFNKRLQKISYYEPVVIKNKNKQFVIFGNEDPKRINKNVILFVLELYAYIESDKKVIMSSEYNKEEILVGKEKLLKFKFKPLKIKNV